MLSGLCRNQGRLPTRRRAPDWRDASLVRCLRGPRPLAKRERTIGVNRAPRPCCWPLLACEAAAATQSRHCCEIRIWPPACSRCLMWPASAARMKRPPPPPLPAKQRPRTPRGIGAALPRPHWREQRVNGRCPRSGARACGCVDAWRRGGAAARLEGRLAALWAVRDGSRAQIHQSFTNQQPISSWPGPCQSDIAHRRRWYTMMNACTASTSARDTGRTVWSSAESHCPPTPPSRR